MNKKSLIIGGIVAVFIVIAIALGIFTKPPVVTPPDTANQAGEYSSRDTGLSFAYPTSYALESRTDGFENKTITVLTLIPKDAVIPDMSEGPPAISVIIVPNPENLPLDEWIRTKSISNWQLSSMGEMGASTVGVEEESGLGYMYSGLYENTAIAVAHGGKIYLFSVGTITADDQIKKDFFNLLDSVKFL